jgi:putative ABC transport system permease protein
MAVVRVGLIAGLGALVAVAVAIASSPLMPIGPARVAEPHPGMEINAAILTIGFVAIIVVLVGRLAWPARRAAYSSPGVLGAPEIAGAERLSRVANGLAARGLPAPVVVGARMALEPGRGRTAVPVRSAVLGTAVAVAAVAGAFTFNANLNRLVSTPRLYGWNWDIGAGVGFFVLPRDVSEELLRHPVVDGVAGAQYGSVELGGREVPALGIDQLGGAPVFPTLLDGRVPNGPDEIALGAKTLRRARRRVGDTVVVKINDASRTLRVVGRAVFPKFSGAGFSSTGLGEGAALTAQLLGPVDQPGEFHSVALIRFKPGVDRARALSGVLPIINSGRFLGCPSALCVSNARSQRPGDLENYARVRGTPLVLAALLAVMAVAALANTLVSSIRRRRRDLAILKTLGFLGHQVSATTAWQATTLVAAALLVGLPLGVAAGRATWLAFARQLGVAEDVRTPVPAALLAVPVTFVIANLIAAIPALAAARTRPAAVLRTE